MFAIVDANNFYASCERVFRPDLNGKPIVILSNNDGCVIARSNEAKKLNIPMAAPAFKFKSVFEQNNVHVFSSNFPLYGDMSSRVMQLLSKFTPDIEIYSIDEAFLKFDNFKYHNLHDYALKIKRVVTRGTGIPISIGIAETKALSKVANRIAKKFPEQTNGIYIIDSEEKRLKALKWLKIEDVWGIGRRNSAKLKNQGINNAFQFTQLPDSIVKKDFTIVGLRLKKELLGESVLDLEPPQPRKSIATTRTFEKGYTQLADIQERVTTFATKSAEKLRKQKSKCNAIMVFLKTDKHKSYKAQSYKNYVLKLPFPTNSTLEIVKLANKALQKIYSDGYEYKKAGVILLDIRFEDIEQLAIFPDQMSNPKHKKLMQAVDLLNKKIGNDKIKLAAQDLNRTWKMKQENLSPFYTTDINQIIEIKTEQNLSDTSKVSDK